MVEVKAAARGFAALNEKSPRDSFFALGMEAEMREIAGLAFGAEFKAFGVKGGERARIRANFEEFVSSCVRCARAEGILEGKREEDVFRWINAHFYSDSGKGASYRPGAHLCESFSSAERPELNCYTSAFAAADVCARLGKRVRVVCSSNHVLLAGSEHFFETNPAGPFLAVGTLELINKDYAHRSVTGLEGLLAVALNQCGNGHMERRLVNDAIKCYRKAIEINPGYSDAFNNLGLAFGEKGKTTAAIAAFGRAIALSPNDSAVHANLGLAFERQGRFEEAEAAYDRALEIDAGDKNAIYNTARMHYLSRKHVMAVCYMGILIESDANDWQALGLRAAALLELDRVDESIAMAGRALKINPEDKFSQTVMESAKSELLNRARRQEETRERRNARGMECRAERQAGNSGKERGKNCVRRAHGCEFKLPIERVVDIEAGHLGLSGSQKARVLKRFDLLAARLASSTYLKWDGVPAEEIDERELFTHISEAMRSNLKVRHVDDALLCESVYSNKFNCYVLCLLVAEACARIGKETRFIVTPDHALLKGEELYYEATAKLPGHSVLKLPSLKHAYPVSWELATGDAAILSLHQVGTREYFAGEFDKSISLFSECLKARPEFGDAWYNLGAAQRLAGRDAESLAAFDKAIEFSPSRWNAWYNRGNALLSMDRPGEAIESFDEAIKLNPAHSLALMNKGIALAWMEKRAEALKCYDESLKISPENVSAWHAKGESLMALERFDEAVVAYGRALEIKPSDAEIQKARRKAIKMARR